MQAVGNILGNLKDMSTKMGEEIEKQNKQIDKIGVKVDGKEFYVFFSFYFAF